MSLIVYSFSELPKYKLIARSIWNHVEGNMSFSREHDTNANVPLFSLKQMWRKENTPVLINCKLVGGKLVLRWLWIIWFPIEVIHMTAHKGSCQAHSHYTKYYIQNVYTLSMNYNRLITFFNHTGRYCTLHLTHLKGATLQIAAA